MEKVSSKLLVLAAALFTANSYGAPPDGRGGPGRGGQIRPYRPAVPIRPIYRGVNLQESKLLIQEGMRAANNHNFRRSENKLRQAHGGLLSLSHSHLKVRVTNALSAALTQLLRGQVRPERTASVVQTRGLEALEAIRQLEYGQDGIGHSATEQQMKNEIDLIVSLVDQVRPARVRNKLAQLRQSVLSSRGKRHELNLAVQTLDNISAKVDIYSGSHYEKMQWIRECAREFKQKITRAFELTSHINQLRAVDIVNRGDRIAIRLGGQETRGFGELKIKKAIKDFTGVALRNQRIAKVIVLAKSQAGGGRVSLEMGETTSAEQIVRGDAQSYQRPGQQTFNRIEIFTSHLSNGEALKLKLRGNIKVQRVVLVLGNGDHYNWAGVRGGSDSYGDVDFWR